MRVRMTGLLLAVFLLPTAAGEMPAGAIDWDFFSGVDVDEQQLIIDYARTSRELQRLSLELARRYPAPLLEMELSRDLSRLRWRTRGDLPGRWREALTCPDDRDSLRRALSSRFPGSARAHWLRLSLGGHRLLSPTAWAPRALLLRPDGSLVRLVMLD